jgi:hypothetical protein
MGMVYNYTFSLEAGVTNTTSDGMTNCYMLGYNTALTFPVKRAYENNGSSTTLRIGGTHTGTFTIEKLWDDNDVISACSVTGNGNAAVISVTTNNSNRSGNAVVAIKAGSNIAWSYHIWVTGYDPDDENAAEHATFTNTYNTNNNGGHFTFMDRNLGATFAGTGSGKGTGLFYQWGRKDPFPATDGAGATTTGSFSFAATSATLGTIPNTIRNPNVFYSAASTPNDWHYAGKIDTLWNHSNNNKTIYDPCPAGWRVPSCAANNNAYGPWNGLSSSGLSFTSGYAYETNAVYPANGLRNTYETGYMGKVWNVGVQGFIWTGSTKNNNGIAYDYMAGRNAQNAEHYRGHGICVRCARE